MALPILLLIPLSLILANDESVYQTSIDFLCEVFEGKPPEAQVLWLDESMRQSAERILGYQYKGFRVRYWQYGERIAWILDEVGKVKPITTGILVENAQIVHLKVLVYRESHGWEVKEEFFTRQFEGVELDEKDRISSVIDNISGATLSVNALKRMSRLALLFTRFVEESK